MIIDCIKKMKIDLERRIDIQKPTVLTKSVLYRITAEPSTVHQMMYRFIYKNILEIRRMDLKYLSKSVKPFQ